MSVNHKYCLSNGLKIPFIGIGTWKINEKKALEIALNTAIENGYRLIDTAAAYCNEIPIGKILKEKSSLRSELFIQNKVWNTNRGYQTTIEACKRSLHKMKLDYFDAYLIHWPASAVEYENWKEINMDTWRAMETLFKDGYTRSIGICNFNEMYLNELLRTAEIIPMLHQIEFHPGYSQMNIVRLSEKYHIHLQASSPLGNGRILKNEKIETIAKQKGKTPAQICLRYALEYGMTVIPKSEKKERIIENKDIADFSLTKQEIEILDNLQDCGGLRLNPDEVLKID